MMAQRNSFINGIGLTEANSLIHLLNNDDTDDDNELHLIKHSAYYGENEFSKLLSSKAGMSIISGNIQSINAKFDGFSSFVDRVNTHNPISAILLQECWIDDSAIDSLALFNLKDYNMVYQSSRCCRHGGLLIYIHKQFKYTLIDTINQDATGWEYLCVEMSHRTPHSQKYLLCNVYRKPGESVDDMNAFIAEFSTLLQRVKNLNKLSYICGDYNIDLLKVKINHRFGEFFDNIISSGFFPKITLPTRFSDHSATLIDNVFSTNIEEKEVSGILLNHISDHQLLFTHIENLSYIEKVPKFINIQKTDPISVDNFVNELREQNIYERMHQPLDTNPNDNYEIFITQFQLAKNKHLPIKRVRYQKRKHKKSKWMTTGILNSINTKDGLYKTLLKTDTNSDDYRIAKANFKRYREILRNSIKRAKMLYYKRTFNLYQNDVKKTWTLIKETLQQKKKQELPAEFIWNDQIITDLDEIANKFNTYFINIGHSLSEQIHATRSSDEYLSNRTNTIFNFTEVNEECIDRIINKMKSKSSTGYDNISNKLIKSARDVLIKPLTLLMNQIIHTGEFPKHLKIAKVKPLFKKGNQSSFTNYRPISLLPSISKIFEHVMTSQLMEYFTSKNLFCLQQFGFRPGHSTELAALKLVNYIITEMDNCNIPTNIYIDLSKAFDTLNFDILLNKLDYYGIQGCANRLIHSYLTDRWQFVDFNGHKSCYLPIKTGVPQGSVLGPLLFLIYINDLPLVSNVFDMLMYADDTTLYCNINQNISEEVINVELLKLWDWLGANKLSLNMAKTKYMVFHTSKRNMIYPNLKVNNNTIERVTEFNFLGVILHSHMTWNKHINHISMKIARSIGILYRLRNVYPESVLVTIYNTLILPHFHYCLLLWGSVVKENHSLHLLQKKAVRIITNSDYLAHTEPICKKLRILKISDMFSVALWKFYYKLMNNKLPAYFSFMKPVLPTATERYEIRNPSFHTPAIKHKFAECSLQYCLINQLNSENCFALLTDKVNLNSFYSFKVFVKSRILNSYQH